MSGFGPSSYEVFPYTGRAYTDTHPDTLATIATLLGMKPPSATRARVLEIGCASGENLIPMAVEVPEGQFLGIELSERQVAQGHATIEAAGLKNVELTRMNILDAGPDLGTFDYIICNGVFSWVAFEVQQKILSLIAATLAPDGVGYVSYNVFPGWHLRGVLREAMLFHIGGEADPKEGFRKARELLDFLVQFPSEPDNHYRTMLRELREQLLRQDDSYVFHEFLEDVNQPLYYHQFVERIAAVGLKAVAEAEFFKSVCVAPEPLKRALQRMSDDPARQEAYCDLLRGRSFRRTLLCHEEVELLAEPAVAAVERLHAALKVLAASFRPEFPDGVPETFQNGRNEAIAIGHSVVKAAVVVLGEHYPRALPFPDLWQAATARLADAGSGAFADERERWRLAVFLLQGYGSGWLELHSHMAPFVREPGERPAATPLARYQARSGACLANLRHEAIELPRFDRHLLALLDGRRSHSDLVDALDALVSEGTLTIRGSAAGTLDTASRRAIVAESLHQGLARLAGSAFLVS